MKCNSKYRKAEKYAKKVFEPFYGCSGQIDLYQDHDTCPDTWRLHFLVSGPNSLISLTWAQEKASGLVPSLHQLRHYLPGSITQPELHDSLKPQQSVQGSPPTGTRPFPEPFRAPTRRPSGACYCFATYSWTTRSPRFTDPATLPDHPHVLNVVTVLY